MMKRRRLISASFYVYKHFRPDTGACFYVGKGGGVGSRIMRRAYTISRTENTHYYGIINKMLCLGCGVGVEIVAENLTEQEAFALECRLIKQIGRHDLGLGSLCNQSDGGEGSSGTVVSAETKALLSKQRRNVPKALRHRAALAAHLKSIYDDPVQRERRAKRLRELNRTTNREKSKNPKSAEHRVNMKIAQAARRARERLGSADGSAMSIETRAKLREKALALWDDPAKRLEQAERARAQHALRGRELI